MTGQVVWVHDEMLRAACVPVDAPAIFVFDSEWIADEQVSLKRIVFLYECLAEMNESRPQPIEIVKGDVVALVSEFAARHGADTITTYRSPLPRIKRQGAALDVRWIDPEPIVTLPEGVDLKRFSRYWRKAEKQVMRRDG
ncbi:MAG: hypothetical protein AAGJ46_02780 [Planctomycetota bacterium]